MRTPFVWSNSAAEPMVAVKLVEKLASHQHHLVGSANHVRSIQEADLDDHAPPPRSQQCDQITRARSLYCLHAIPSQPLRSRTRTGC
jgi:hypothetical protein